MVSKSLPTLIRKADDDDDDHHDNLPIHERGEPLLLEQSVAQPWRHSPHDNGRDKTFPIANPFDFFIYWLRKCWHRAIQTQRRTKRKLEMTACRDNRFFGWVVQSASFKYSSVLSFENPLVRSFLTRPINTDGEENKKKKKKTQEKGMVFTEIYRRSRLIMFAISGISGHETFTIWPSISTTSLHLCCFGIFCVVVLCSRCWRKRVIILSSTTHCVCVCAFKNGQCFIWASVRCWCWTIASASIFFPKDNQNLRPDGHA